MSRLAFLLLFAAPLVAAPVPKPKPTLEGVWEVVERQNDAKPHPVRGEFWVFKGNVIMVYDAKDAADLKEEKGSEMRLELPDEGDPSLIDAVMTLDRGRKYTCLGRVEFDGGTVRLAFGAGNRSPRPEKCEPAVGVAYIVFKKVDEAKLKAK